MGAKGHSAKPVDFTAADGMECAVALQQKGAILDRFGLFTAHIGGSFVNIYFDDLEYTAGSGR